MDKIKKYITYLLPALAITIAGLIIYVLPYHDDLELKSGKDQTIYITSDIHFLSNSINDHGAAFQKYISGGDGKQLSYINEITDAFVYDVKNTKPDILILSGDLTNNGEKASHLDLAKKLKSIEDGGTKVYVIPGNHDIYNPWARKFQGDKQYLTDYISDTDFSNIYTDFGYSEAISRDNASLSYLAAPSQKVWLLMLDTTRFTDNLNLGMPRTDGILKLESLNWITECSKLAKEKGATIITVMHHNILNHSEVIREGFTLNNSGQALILFKEDNLNLVFSGHIHVQDISSDKSKAGTLYDIASGALSVNPHQYGVLEYHDESKSFDYHTALVDVEHWARKMKIKNNDLRHFKKYEENYFGTNAYNRAYKKLSDAGGYSEEQMKLMADTMKTLNMRYFAGTEYLNAKDMINSKGYQLWINSQDGFQKGYIESITTDKDTDDTRLHIDLSSVNASDQ